MRREKREELEKLTERNSGRCDMATVVKMKLSVHGIAGGDYVGDIDSVTTREQFVHHENGGEADLGWCLGVHVMQMMRRVLTTPELLVSFKDAVVDDVVTYLDETRDAIDVIEKGSETKD